MIKACDNPCMVVSGATQLSFDEQKMLLPRMSLQPGKPILFNTMTPSLVTDVNSRAYRAPNQPILHVFNPHESPWAEAYFTVAYYKICTKLLWDKIPITPHAYYYPNGEIKVHLNKLLLKYDISSNTFKHLNGDQPTREELLQSAHYRPPCVIFDENIVPEVSMAYTHGMHLLKEIDSTLSRMGVQNFPRPDTLIYTRKHPEFTTILYNPYHFLYHRNTGAIKFFDAKSDCLLHLNRATVRTVFTSLPTLISNNNLMVWILHRKVALRVHAIMHRPLAPNLKITWDEPYIKIMRNDKKCWYDLTTQHFMHIDRVTGTLKVMKGSDLHRIVVKRQKKTNASSCTNVSNFTKVVGHPDYIFQL